MVRTTGREGPRVQGPKRSKADIQRAKEIKERMEEEGKIRYNITDEVAWTKAYAERKEKPVSKQMLSHFAIGSKPLTKFGVKWDWKFGQSYWQQRSKLQEEEHVKEVKAIAEQKELERKEAEEQARKDEALKDFVASAMKVDAFVKKLEVKQEQATSPVEIKAISQAVEKTKGIFRNIKKKYMHVYKEDAERIHATLRSVGAIQRDQKTQSKQIATDWRWLNKPGRYDYPGVDTPDAELNKNPYFVDRMTNEAHRLATVLSKRIERNNKRWWKMHDRLKKEDRDSDKWEKLEDKFKPKQARVDESNYQALELWYKKVKPYLQTDAPAIVQIDDINFDDPPWASKKESHKPTKKKKE